MVLLYNVYTALLWLAAVTSFVLGMSSAEAVGVPLMLLSIGVVCVGNDAMGLVSAGSAPRSCGSYWYSVGTRTI